jgi:hypothetical protein
VRSSGEALPRRLQRRQTYGEVNGVRDERSDRTLRIAGRGSAAAHLCNAHTLGRELMIVLVGDAGLATGDMRVRRDLRV